MKFQSHLAKPSKKPIKKKKMKPVILNSQLNKNNLWNGCILASFAHAIMVTHYHGLPYEHSWGGDNYSVVDGRSYNTPNKRNH